MISYKPLLCVWRACEVWEGLMFFFLSIFIMNCLHRNIARSFVGFIFSYRSIYSKITFSQKKSFKNTKRGTRSDSTGGLEAKRIIDKLTVLGISFKFSFNLQVPKRNRVCPNMAY